MSLPTASAPAHITGWDRAVIILLGGAGSALSYDALQQMAVAIHVRGLLTYLFPLVIDGFIAYGVRALLVLRTAPLRARLYVWTLFGTATAASIWANALHAVRLNQQTASSSGLRLGNTVVAILSTLAPLALAGAVHLYILIARGPAKDSDRHQPGQLGQPAWSPVTRTDHPGQQSTAGQVTAGQSASALSWTPAPDTERPALTPVTPRPDIPAVTEDNASADNSSQDAEPVSGAAELHGHPDGTTEDTGQPRTAGAVGDRPTVVLHPVTGQDNASGDRAASPRSVGDRDPATSRSVADRDSRTTGDGKVDPDTERLLEIAREAVKAQDKLTRKVVAEAIRGQDIPLSNDRLTALMIRLRETSGQHHRDHAGHPLQDCLS